MRILQRLMAAIRRPPLPPAHVREDAAAAAIEFYPMENGHGWIYRKKEKYCGWYQYKGDPRKAKSYVEGNCRRDVAKALEKINKVIQDKVLLINSWNPNEEEK